MINPKVLVIPSWYPVEQGNLSGIYIAEHARALADSLQHVGVMYKDWLPPGWRGQFVDRQTDGVVEVMLRQWNPWKIPLLRAIWLRQYLRLYYAFKERYWRPDILHAHGFVAAIAAQHIASHEGVPYVVTEHNTTVLRHRIPPHYKRAVRRAYRNADGLIAVWHPLAKAMERYAGSNPVTVIPNPVDFTRLDIHRSPKAAPGHKFVTVGALTRRKNLDVLIRAFALYASANENSQLVIIGDGPQRQELQALIRKSGLSHSVKLAGWKTPADVAQLLSSSDIFVTASKIETFGIALVEAMACGLPVICTQSGGVDDIVTPASGMVVEPDCKALTRAMTQMSERLEEYDAHEIRNKARAKFDFPVVAGQVLDYYANIMQRTS